jgi:hypothetical protein
MAVIINASTSTGLVQSADTSGTIELQSNGTTKATVSSSGLAIGQYNPSTSLVTSSTAVASTSGTSIDFTSIPSWVKRITVMFDSVSTNGTSQILIQIGDSGGIETTGYNSAAFFGANAGQFTTSTSGLILEPTAGAAAASLRYGSIILSLLSANTWTEQFGLYSTGVGSGLTGGGAKALSDVLDRVRITTVNGTDTFDAGSINILYE